MARIKISTLNSVNSEISWASNSLLNELTDWEMKAVVGGTNGLVDIQEMLLQALLDVTKMHLEASSDSSDDS
ncbi:MULTISPECIES: hypothetical protein [unclassified Chroococcidiopsis]|uniref:hypothetical protein n=1 Tax=unclassified Chroococcidiopsis TaxID=2646205 RepID=UPI00293739BF|nr:hypothetical protein [Chroococcidiopsis sp. SAG 2025]MDV2997613.1 hypothetical protein [Chroococcidiopsis sp. SAG 2025]